MKNNTINIDGIEYVQANKARATRLDGMEYVIIRSVDSGVHAGYLLKEETSDRAVTLGSARRLWYWEGAASLSQLASEGVNAPDKCKFPCEVEEIKIFGVCEIIPATETARQSIASVEIWAA
jgi:hypothetical protein